VAPVAVGTGSAYALGGGDLGLALLALLVSVGLQIGVNYANDYSDGVRGTDEDRVGPVRLVGQRLADPANVRLMAFLWFGFAALCGLALVALTNTWVLLLLGAAAIIAAWRYTGGKNPYGYRGLGELMVFVFFGLFAVLGTTWTQAKALDLASWAGAVGVGAVACAILVVNNLRDIPGDSAAGKRTLAVRLGDRRTRMLYVGLLVLALLMSAAAGFAHPWALLGLLAAPLALLAARPVVLRARGRDLVPVIGGTGLYQLGYAALLTLGLVL
jgi:1,4-dihydroxy-2-naphthoate octaprenyltransferase